MFLLLLLAMKNEFNKRCTTKSLQLATYVRVKVIKANNFFPSTLRTKHTGMLNNSCKIKCNYQDENDCYLHQTNLHRFYYSHFVGILDHS